jgi:HSP20 family protein
MDRIWDNFLGDTHFNRRFKENWGPHVDVSEDKTNIVVSAELPGMEATDVEVSLTGDVLTIKGEKKEEKEKKEGTDEYQHVVERSYGMFQRSFQLPANIQGDDVKASFDKGVLKIVLPKTEEARKKEISVEVK